MDTISCFLLHTKWHRYSVFTERGKHQMPRNVCIKRGQVCCHRQISFPSCILLGCIEDVLQFYFLGIGIIWVDYFDRSQQLCAPWSSHAVDCCNIQVHKSYSAFDDVSPDMSSFGPQRRQPNSTGSPDIPHAQASSLRLLCNMPATGKETKLEWAFISTWTYCLHFLSWWYHGLGMWVLSITQNKVYLDLLVFLWVVRQGMDYRCVVS